MEDDALALHLRDAPVDMALLHLEIGNAVAQQAARLGVLLEQMDLVADAGQLLGAGEAGRPRADDRDSLAGPLRGRLRLDPALRPGAVDDRAFDRLDRHRTVLQIQRAGRFAGRRADAAGEFGKVVGGVEIARRLFPVAAIDEVVPVGDLVVDRAAGMAIGNAAIHAARRLVARRFFRQRQHEFAIMANAVGSLRIAPVRAIDLQKPRNLAHDSTIRRSE